MKKPIRKTTSDAMTILSRRYLKDRPALRVMLEEERANSQIAAVVFQLRQRAGVTQGQLAKVVGTTPSVISRLEDADYRGHSLGMLRRIAAALHQRVELRFVPLRRRGRAA